MPGEDFPVEVGPKQAAGELCIAAGPRGQQSRGGERFLQGSRLGLIGHAGVAAMEDVKVRERLRAAVAEVELTEQGRGDDAGW